MDKKKRLFQHIGANDCPNCGKHGLYLIERETTFGKMDDEGRVAKTIPMDYEVKLACPHCISIFDVKKNGLFFSIDYGFPEYKPIVEDYNPFIQG